MAKKYTYSQHPRVQEREQQGPVTVHVSRAVTHRATRAQRFNNRVGLAITKSVGTMWAAYAFCVLSLISLPSVIATGQLLVIVSWIAQTFLQLVLLPVIIVGQNIQAKASDDRAIATYKDAGAILEESKEIQSHLGTQDEALSELIAKVAALEAKLMAAQKPAAAPKPAAARSASAKPATPKTKPAK